MAGKLVYSKTLDYGVTPVTTGAWVQIEPSLPANVRKIEVFDSSGSVIELAYGPAGSETMAIILAPGGRTLEPCLLNMGMALSLRALDANASSGQFVLNAFY